MVFTVTNSCLVSKGIIYLCLPDRKRSAIMDKDVFDIAGTGAVVIFA